MLYGNPVIRPTGTRGDQLPRWSAIFARKPREPLFICRGRDVVRIAPAVVGGYSIRRQFAHGTTAAPKYPGRDLRRRSASQKSGLLLAVISLLLCLPAPVSEGGRNWIYAEACWMVWWLCRGQLGGGICWPTSWVVEIPETRYTPPVRQAKLKICWLWSFHDCASKERACFSC